MKSAAVLHPIIALTVFQMSKNRGAGFDLIKINLYLPSSAQA